MQPAFTFPAQQYFQVFHITSNQIQARYWGSPKGFFKDSGLGHGSGFKAKWGQDFGIRSMDNMWDVANNNYREYGIEPNVGQDNRMEEPH